MRFQQRADTKALLWKSGQCHSNHFIAIIVQSPQMNTVELAMTQFTIIYPQTVIVQLKNLMRSQAHQLNNHRTQIVQWTRASSLFLSQSGTAFGFHRNNFPIQNKSVNTDQYSYSSLCKQSKERQAKEIWRGKTNLEHDKTVRMTELRYSIHDYIHLWCTPLLLWNTVGEKKKRWVHYWPKTGWSTTVNVLSDL